MSNNTSKYAGKSAQELLAIIAQLEAAQPKPKELTFHISAKTGALVVKNWGRFPLTAYLSQLDRLFAAMDSLKSFVEKYRKYFAVKGQAWDSKVLADLPAGIVITPAESAE